MSIALLRYFDGGKTFSIFIHDIIDVEILLNYYNLIRVRYILDQEIFYLH